MKAFAAVIVTSLLTQAIAMPVVKRTSGRATQAPVPSTLATPANIPYDELLYILKVRGGENPLPKRLTPCARAILGCCRDARMNEHCSESLKCGAFFFDVNPCEDKYVIDALNAARAFYEQFNTVTR